MAVDAICCTFDSLLATLDEISKGDDHVKGVEAKGLLLQVKSFSFLPLLIIFDRVLSCTKKLSDLLQNQQCNLAKAADLVSATIQTLEEFRSDTSWNCLFRYAQHVAETNEISATFDRQKRRRRLPLRFGESIVLNLWVQG